MSIKSPLLAFLGLVLVGLISFTATAHAAAAVTPSDGTLLDALGPILAAFQTGSYLYAGSLALVLAVALTRRYAEPRYPWLSTDAGAGTLTLIGSFGASMVTRGVGGIEYTWAMAWSSLEIAFGAAGGYTLVKALLISPYLTKLVGKGPAWLHTPMQLILWIFQETGEAPTPAQQAVHAVEAINRPDIDVTVAVTTPEGSAVATSPAVAPPAPVTVVTSRTTTKP